MVENSRKRQATLSSTASTFMLSALRRAGYDFSYVEPDSNNKTGMITPPTSSSSTSSSPPPPPLSATVVPRYAHALPIDIEPIRAFLVQYSGMRIEDVDEHVFDIRDKLWDLYPYSCVGHFRFLSLDFTEDELYQTALHGMLQKEPIGSHPPRFLDVGCCVGQVLRKLTADGVDSSRLYGTDLESRFHDAGYDLFRDRETFKGSFVAGDMLRKTESGRERKSKGASRRTSTDDPLEALDGKMTYIHAASFFHLFTWDEQLRAAIRMQRFLSSTDSTTTRTDSSDSRTRLKAMIFGRQVGTLTPRERLGKQGSDKVYLHNAESWQMLWDEVGALTGTEWAAAMYPIETIRTATPESSLRKMAFCVVRRT